MNSQQAKTLSAADDMSQNFLTLFLAQLKNQDPLNPLDNADMTSQLAQINVVSGLEKLNETMNTLLASYGEALSLQAANLIGKNVLVPGNQMVLTENGALFGAELEGPADMLEVVIKDATGKEVRRQNLGAQDAGAQAFYWDGTDMNGEVLEPGYYSFSIAASLGDSPVLNKTMQVGTVSALVRSNNGGFKLDVAGLGNVNLSDVRQVF
jgi:flagellar basal-body rod modification protein FlgD